MKERDWMPLKSGVDGDALRGYGMTQAQQEWGRGALGTPGSSFTLRDVVVHHDDSRLFFGGEPDTAFYLPMDSECMSAW